METESFGKKPYLILKKKVLTQKKRAQKKKMKNEIKNKRKKWIINILSALKHCIAISQPSKIVSFICYMAVKLQKNAPNQ